MKFLSLTVVIAVLVAASAAFVSNESQALQACVSHCQSVNTGQVKPTAPAGRPSSSKNT